MVKRIISLLLCLVLGFGIVPAEAIAVYTPEQDDNAITPIGNIDGVPILSEDDAIKLADEYYGPETEEEFVDLLLSDSEEAKAYFGESEDERYKDYIGAEYWDHLPEYGPVNYDRPYTEYCIQLENDQYYPIFRYDRDDKGRCKMYYLYCLYKMGKFQAQDGELVKASKAQSYTFSYFYTTLPYTQDNVQGWTAHCSKMPGTRNGNKFTPKDGASEYGSLPVPKSIFNVLGLRSYSKGQMRWGGVQYYSNGKTVPYDGMEEIWFQYATGGKWPGRYDGYNNPTKFDFTDLNDNNKSQHNTELKNAISPFPFDGKSGVSTPSEFSNLNPMGGTIRIATEHDAGAFIKIEDIYYTSRQNISALMQGKIATSTSVWFPDDTAFPTSWDGGFYNPNIINWKPWRTQGLGELGNGGITAPAKYSGTVNSYFITKKGTNKTNNLTFNDVLMDTNSLLYKYYQMGALKAQWISETDKRKMYQDYINIYKSRGGGEEAAKTAFAKDLETIYGKGYNVSDFLAPGFYLYLDKDFTVSPDSPYSEIDWEKDVENTRRQIEGIYGLVRSMESAFGNHNANSLYPKDTYIYSCTGESLELQDGAWHKLITGQGTSTNIFDLNLTLNNNYALGSGNNKYFFFARPNFVSLANTNCSLTAEQQKCIDGANVLGKFLYMLCYMSVESLMGDPTKPLMEDGKYPAVSHFVTTKTQNEIRYSSNSLPRALDYAPDTYDTYPLPTVTKDLVVADTEENPIYEELEGKYEKEYMGSNLAR